MLCNAPLGVLGDLLRKIRPLLRRNAASSTTNPDAGMHRKIQGPLAPPE